jgi:hypothetical protein
MLIKIHFFGFIIVSCFCISFVSLQGQSKRQILFSIGNDEIPVYDESRIYIENSGTSVSMVTMNFDKKYFLYENGEKKGPFENTESCGFEPGENEENMNSSTYNFEGANIQEDLVYNNDNYQSMIRAGDKKYGPFEAIMSVYADKNGKFLMALTSEGMKFSILTTNGTLIPLDGIPNGISVSPSQNKVMMVVVKEENPALEYMSLDFSKMTQEEIMKVAKEMEEKQKNAPPPEAFIYFNDGKKFGPYPKDPVFGGNPGFCKTGGDNWVFLIGKDLYVNGSLLASLPVDYVSASDIWLSEDGKRYAIISYERILFSDGQSFEYPLKIKRVEKDGLTWLNWISLENKTDIVLYSKPL